MTFCSNVLALKIVKNVMMERLVWHLNKINQKNSCKIALARKITKNVMME
jgi:hypothetical protein